jgi:hypothetical protein
MGPDHSLHKRTASFSADFLVNDTDIDNRVRLEKVRAQIFETFEETRIAVRDEVAVVNRDNLFLAISNFIGSSHIQTQFLRLNFKTIMFMKYFCWPVPLFLSIHKSHKQSILSHFAQQRCWVSLKTIHPGEIGTQIHGPICCPLCHAAIGAVTVTYVHTNSQTRPPMKECNCYLFLLKPNYVL